MKNKSIDIVALKFFVVGYFTALAVVKLDSFEW
jgi:hypothetical protein